MITLRLFHSARPFEQIAERPLAEGDLIIGRDSSAGWQIPDAREDVSRYHCTLMLEAGRICLRNTSANGVLIGDGKRPAPRDETCDVEPGDTFHIGEYMILLDVEAPEIAAPEKPVKQPRQQSGAPLTDAAMLEAFCEGAGLEPSSFAGEDPAAVMSRLGVVYRQVVDDLCALMRDRAMLRDQLQMDRTTIAARDNNPLKWAPPHRIAVELLQEGDTGFLKGAAAFKASFADLRRHSTCVVAGWQAAVRHVLDDLSPDAVETSLKRQPMQFVLKSEAAWKLFRERHAAMSADTDWSGSGAVERAFRRAYEERLAALGPDRDEAA
jgi:predicted component of type VI protein secretion system